MHNIKIMNSDDKFWKLPVALGMILCSVVPVSLVTFIETVEVRGSAWAHYHRVLPYIARTYQDYHHLGLILPVVTIGVAVWFLAGKSFTLVKFAWLVLMLVALHLLWLSYAVAAFYFANQTFH